MVEWRFHHLEFFHVVNQEGSGGGIGNKDRAGSRDEQKEN